MSFSLNTNLSSKTVRAVINGTMMIFKDYIFPLGTTKSHMFKILRQSRKESQPCPVFFLLSE